MFILGSSKLMQTSFRSKLASLVSSDATLCFSRCHLITTHLFSAVDGLIHAQSIDFQNRRHGRDHRVYASFSLNGAE
jgi:hypothetical protein